MSKSGAKFDFEKAKWFNQQYIKETSVDDLLETLRGDFVEAGIDKDDDFLKKYISLFIDRVTFIKEFISVGYYIFEKPKEYNEVQFNKRWTKEGIPSTFDNIYSDLNAVSDWTATNIEAVIKNAMEANSLKPGEIMPVFRIMISGEAGGPPLFELAEMIGKIEVLERVKAAITHFSK